ncbi:hypothetical protein BDF14DRAFT_1886094 [Spinellus fusiger]|nr:hypothetical protein BDF14DRAFT_1886094 [Spinellus fusiger]
MSCVVVLGGGISGLSTTYYLSKFAPRTTKIVLIEAKDRVGGWIQSKRVSGGLHVSPTHCPNGILLETSSEVLRTKSSRGAVVFDMKHVTLPASSYVPRESQSTAITKLLNCPQFEQNHRQSTSHCKGTFESILVEPLVSQNKQGDESLYDFVHPPFQQDYGSVLKGYYKHEVNAEKDSFQQGLQALPDQLHNYLAQCENVEIRLNEKITTTVDVAVVSLAYSPQASNYTGTGFALPYPATNNHCSLSWDMSVSCESNLLKHQDPHDSFKMMIAMGGHQWNEAFGNITH